MDGVDSQAIDVEFVDPVSGIGDEELSDRRGKLRVEVDRLAPVRAMTLGRVFGRELGQIIAGRAEVVVDHVEQHAELEPMGLVHEPAEIIRRSIEPSRREQIDAVVAPAKAAVEFGDRHDLDERDAEFGQTRQFRDGGGKCSFASERADV